MKKFRREFLSSFSRQNFLFLMSAVIFFALAFSAFSFCKTVNHGIPIYGVQTLFSVEKAPEANKSNIIEQVTEIADAKSAAIYRVAGEFDSTDDDMVLYKIGATSMDSYPNFSSDYTIVVKDSNALLEERSLVGAYATNLDSANIKALVTALNEIGFEAEYDSSSDKILQAEINTFFEIGLGTVFVVLFLQFIMLTIYISDKQKKTSAIMISSGYSNRRIVTYFLTRILLANLLAFISVLLLSAIFLFFYNGLNQFSLFLEIYIVVTFVFIIFELLASWVFLKVPKSKIYQILKINSSSMKYRTVSFVAQILIFVLLLCSIGNVIKTTESLEKQSEYLTEWMPESNVYQVFLDLSFDSKYSSEANSKWVKIIEDSMTENKAIQMHINYLAGPDKPPSVPIKPNLLIVNERYLSTAKAFDILPDFDDQEQDKLQIFYPKDSSQTSGDIDKVKAKKNVCESISKQNQECLTFIEHQYSNTEANCFSDLGTNANRPFCDAIIAVLPNNILVGTDEDNVAEISSARILFTDKDDIKQKIDDSGLKWMVSSVEDTQENVKEQIRKLNDALDNQVFSVVILILSLIYSVWMTTSLFVDRLRRKLFIQTISGWGMKKYFALMLEFMISFLISAAIASTQIHGEFFVKSTLYVAVALVVCVTVSTFINDRRITNLAIKIR